MKCHYCGKEVWLVRHLLDGDFCSPAHRKKYHERLRRALDQLPTVDGPPASVAEFLFAVSAKDAYLHGKTRICGFQSNLPWPYLPHTTPELAPLNTQTFFGPNVAMAPPGTRARSAELAGLATSEPRLKTLNTSFTAALRATIDFADRPVTLAVNCAADAPALPMPVTPEALAARPAEMRCPKLGISTVLADGLVGVEAPVQPSRAIGVRTATRFIPTALEAVMLASQPKSWLDVQPPARPSVNGRPRLRLTPCVLPVPGSALLAEGTVSCGTVRASCEVLPIATPLYLQSPALPKCRRPGPASEVKAIWRISVATPWSVAQETAVEAIPARPAAAMLPAMALAPVLPGLQAESGSRPIDALPVGAAARAHNHGIAPVSTARPALTPAICAAEMSAALPEARTPRVAGAESMAPQQMPAIPAMEMPIASEARPLAGGLAQSLAPCIEVCAGAAAQFRLCGADPLPHSMPAFIPQAAVARSRDSIRSNGSAAATLAMPVTGAAGFGTSAFLAVAPASAVSESRRVAPIPETISKAPASFQASLSITDIGPLSPAGAIPLDVYVQRARAASRRECEWRELARPALAQPMAMPELSPARFEQQVLQDWRRRYPARQMAAAPAPVTPKTVVPITRQLSAFARLRKAAPQFGKGLAAAAMVGAIAWLGWGMKGVRQTVITDRQWLRTAIAQRASLVLDDNFRSGLNLWDGRKNWARSWSYSQDGFMRTGQLALYRPSLGMRDYRLEFFGQIESKSVGWVVRAKDEKNYYAVKLAVTEPGPRPLVSVVRYAVTAGMRGKRVQIPLPIMMHNNTPYHVAVDVKGNHFRAYIENQEVDSWNDDRLHAGGVGFFSENGERARLYWVKVSNHTDWLGRLCGMLSEAKGQDQASNLWNPAEPGEMAALDPNSILDGGKNADRRRAMPVLPFAMLYRGGSL